MLCILELLVLDDFRVSCGNMNPARSDCKIKLHPKIFSKGDKFQLNTDQLKTLIFYVIREPCSGYHSIFHGLLLNKYKYGDLDLLFKILVTTSLTTYINADTARLI